MPPPEQRSRGSRQRTLILVLVCLTVLAGAERLMQVAQPEGAVGYDFVPYYLAGRLATSPDAGAVYDRVPERRFEVPPDGRIAEEARSAGYDGTPGQFVNLPVVMLLFAPLSAFELEGAFTVFTAINVGALVFGAYLTAKFAFAGRGGTQVAIGFLCLWLVASVSHPTLHNLQLGNFSTALWTAVIVAWALDRSDRQVLAGLVMGLAILLKPAPGLLLVFFGLRGRWRLVAVALGTIAVSMSIGLAYYGVEMHRRCLDMLGFNATHICVAWNNASIPAAMMRAVVPPEEVLGWEVFPVRPWMTWANRAVLVALLVTWAADFKRWRNEHGSALAFGAGAILMTVPLPYAWTHYYGVQLWAFAFVAAHLAQRARPILGWSILAVLVVLQIPSPLDVLRYLDPEGTSPWLLAQAVPSAILVSALGALVWLHVLQRDVDASLDRRQT